MKNTRMSWLLNFIKGYDKMDEEVKKNIFYGVLKALVREYEIERTDYDEAIEIISREINR